MIFEKLIEWQQQGAFRNFSIKTRPFDWKEELPECFVIEISEKEFRYGMTVVKDYALKDADMVREWIKFMDNKLRDLYLGNIHQLSENQT